MEKLTVHSVLELIGSAPVIPAVKDEAGLSALAHTEAGLAFILYGDICQIGTIVEQVKASGKLAFVHVDLISGLSAKEIAADFLAANTKADGIISTKPAVIRRARELGLFTIQRFFLLDSLAFSNIHGQIETAKPDMIEVLPGGMQKVIRQLCLRENTPVIAGGLMMDKDDVIGALGAGAVGVSTTKSALWTL